MSLQFGTSQAQNARLYYEKLVYTGFPFAGSSSSSLNTGITTLYNASRWNKQNNPTWQSRLEMVQGTQNSNVTIKWSADAQNMMQGSNAASQQTNSLPSGQRQLPMMVPGIDSALLQLNNTNGSATSNYQFNYAVGMKRLNVMEKLMARLAGYGNAGYSLTATEKAALDSLGISRSGKSGLQQAQDLVSKGTSPIGIERILNGIYENRTLHKEPQMFYPTATTADTVVATFNASIDPQDPTSGKFVVLTDIAVEDAANVTVTVDRDGQLGYMQVNGAGFVQADYSPWQCWVPAVNYLTIHVTDGPGNTANTDCSLRFTVQEFDMSDVIAVQFGLIEHASDLPDGVFSKALIGLA